MWDGGVTSELFQRLVRQGDIKPKAGTNGLTNERPGERSHTAAHPGVMTDAGGGVPEPAYEPRETRSPIRLIANNTSMRQTARSTASLTVVR